MIAFVLAGTVHSGRARAADAEKRTGTDEVAVDVHADVPAAQLERIAPGGAIPICTTPCKRTLSREDLYRMAGEGIVPSASFSLPSNRDALALSVRAGSLTQRKIGLTLGLGGVATLVGTSLYGLYKVSSGISNNTFDVLLTGDLISAAVGGLGAALILTAHTQVTTDDGVTF